MPLGLRLQASKNYQNSGALCLGVESHWLWGQPMVSMVGCGGLKTNLTLSDKGTLTSATGFVNMTRKTTHPSIKFSV